jgi:hypothetical protein
MRVLRDELRVRERLVRRVELRRGTPGFDGARFVGNSWFDETSFGSDA